MKKLLLFFLALSFTVSGWGQISEISLVNFEFGQDPEFVELQGKLFMVGSNSVNDRSNIIYSVDINGNITREYDPTTVSTNYEISGLTIYNGQLYFAMGDSSKTPFINRLYRFIGNNQAQLVSSVISVTRGEMIVYEDRLYFSGKINDASDIGLIRYNAGSGFAVVNNVVSGNDFDPERFTIRTDNNVLFFFDQVGFYNNSSEPIYQLFRLDAQNNATSIVGSALGNINWRGFSPPGLASFNDYLFIIGQQDNENEASLYRVSAVTQFTKLGFTGISRSSFVNSTSNNVGATIYQNKIALFRSSTSNNIYDRLLLINIDNSFTEYTIPSGIDGRDFLGSLNDALVFRGIDSSFRDHLYEFRENTGNLLPQIRLVQDYIPSDTYRPFYGYTYNNLFYHFGRAKFSSGNLDRRLHVYDPKVININSLTIQTQGDLNFFGSLGFQKFIGSQFFIASFAVTSKINDLTPLSSLEEVNAGLFTIDALEIQNLNGLESLNNVSGNFVITENNQLTTLNGINSSIRLNGNVTINQNSQLINFCALQTWALNFPQRESNYSATNNSYNPTFIQLQSTSTCSDVCTPVRFADANLKAFLLNPDDPNRIIDFQGNPVNLNVGGEVCAEAASSVAELHLSGGYNGNPFTSLIGGSADGPDARNPNDITNGLIAFTNLNYLSISDNNFSPRLQVPTTSVETLIANNCVPSTGSVFFGADLDDNNGTNYLNNVRTFEFRDNWNNVNFNARVTFSGVPNVQFADVSNTNIKGINITPTIWNGIITLIANDSQLDEITGLENATFLQFLEVKNTNLTGNYDLRPNVDLTRLEAEEANISSITVSSANSFLSRISIFGQGSNDDSLTAVNIEGTLPALNSLDISTNRNLNTIDLTRTPLLDTFQSFGTNITRLDFTALQSAGAGNFFINDTNGTLQEIDVRNNNPSFVLADFVLDATGHPNLSCVLVNQSDLTTAQNNVANNTWQFDNSSVVGTSCATCTPVVFVDGNLKAFFLDPNNSPRILDSNGTAVTGLVIGGEVCSEKAIEVFEINLNGGFNNNPITSLGGLEDFTNLGELRIVNAQLSGDVDLRPFIKLEIFNAEENSITSVTASNVNNQLRRISIFGQGANNDVLNAVNIEGTLPALNSLDISTNRNLNTIDLTRTPLLDTFQSFGTNISRLDFTALQSAGAGNFFISDTNGTLQEIDVRNNNPSFVLADFELDATGHPNLSCVLVNQSDLTTAQNNVANNTWQFDNSSVVGTSCATCTPVVFVDGNLKAFFLDPNNAPRILDVNGSPVTGLTAGGEVCAEKASEVYAIDLDGGHNNTPITSLGGLEAFTILGELRIADAQLSGAIDLTLLPTLEIFNAEENGITSVSASSANTVLRRISIYGQGANDNVLTSVSFNGTLPALNSLDISGNSSLSSIDLTRTPLLDTFQSFGTSITFLDFTALLGAGAGNFFVFENSGNGKLNQIDVRNSNASFDIASFELDATGHPNLTCVLVNPGDLSTAQNNVTIATWIFESADVVRTSCPVCTPVAFADANLKAFFLDPINASRILDVNGSPVTGLIAGGEVCAEKAIEVYEVNLSGGLNNTPIGSIADLEAFTNLRVLQISDAQLTGDVDLSPLANLSIFEGSGNEITSLTASGTNSQLTRIDVSFQGAGENVLLSVSLQGNLPQLSSLSLQNNRNLGAIDLTRTPNLSNLRPDNTAITKLDLTAIADLDAFDTTYFKDEEGDGNLQEIDLRNNTGNFTVATFSFDATGHPFLRCLLVNQTDLATAQNNVTNGTWVFDRADVVKTQCDSISDMDNDGIADSEDNCPTNSNADQADLDNDNLGDVCDTDLDGDGFDNDVDAFPEDPTETEDNDGDGIGDNADNDDDNDGVLDSDDLCPLEAGLTIDDGCPTDIFIDQEDILIIVLNETCAGKNNGSLEIIIENEDLTFNLFLDGTAVGIADFENSLIINDLAGGSYQICARVDALPNYEQCFGIKMNTYERISIDPKGVDVSNLTARFDVEGSRNYEVLVNDNLYYYEFTSNAKRTIEVPMEKGQNKVTITGKSDCQGVYSDVIIIGNITIYPNPVADLLFMNGFKAEGKADIRIYSIGGQLVRKMFDDITNGSIRIIFTELQSGIYVVKTITNKEHIEFKIIKE